jgi:hypothetical protein
MGKLFKISNPTIVENQVEEKNQLHVSHFGCHASHFSVLGLWPNNMTTAVAFLNTEKASYTNMAPWLVK